MLAILRLYELTNLLKLALAVISGVRNTPALQFNIATNGGQQVNAAK
jgi:hypothetical protein